MRKDWKKRDFNYKSFHLKTWSLSKICQKSCSKAPERGEGAYTYDIHTIGLGRMLRDTNTEKPSVLRILLLSPPQHKRGSIMQN